MEYTNEIVNNIKKANIDALKNRDNVAKGIFSILLNKIMLENIKKREKGEEITDADVVQIIQSKTKELMEEKDNFEKVGNSAEVADIKRQIELIGQFLPAMMTEEEIKAEILSLPDQTVPTVMKHFKANFAGKCDMRVVSEVLKGI